MNPAAALTTFFNTLKSSSVVAGGCQACRTCLRFSSLPPWIRMWGRPCVRTPPLCHCLFARRETRASTEQAVGLLVFVNRFQAEDLSCRAPETLASVDPVFASTLQIHLSRTGGGELDHSATHPDRDVLA